MSEDIERHVIRKFEINQRLGKGAYGVVWKAVEKRSRAVVALKKCFDAFRNATDAQRTFREIMYLQVRFNPIFSYYLLVIFYSYFLSFLCIFYSFDHEYLQALSGHENIIRLQHVIKAENDADIYLTFDHMETGNIIAHDKLTTMPLNSATLSVISSEILRASC